MPNIIRVVTIFTIEMVGCIVWIRRFAGGLQGWAKSAHRFVKDLTQHAENAELYAVAARDQSRADLFAREYDCQKSYGDYTQAT